MVETHHSEEVPKTMQATFNSIVNLTDAFAHQHLNAAYAQLIRYATAAMCRENPAPLTRGQPKGWACGMTHAIGAVNLLFGGSQDVHKRETELFEAFEVSRRNCLAKSKVILDTLDATPFDPEWRISSSREDAESSQTWTSLLERALAGVRKRPRASQGQDDQPEVLPHRPNQGGKRAGKNRRKRAQKVTRMQRRCGLCGGTGALTKTDCCDQWICDDAHTYRLFSYARNSCYRNHDRYTLCSGHYHEGHAGHWQTCDACKEGFETEMYVYYGTNEYNFEVLKNPPKYKPTTCGACGRVIVLGDGGYSIGPDGYKCVVCTEKEFGNRF